MSSYCLKYEKGDEVRYISHLDFLRCINRAIKRSALPVSYSQGFNPHTIMTVALPASVGTTSGAELMKVSFDEELTADIVRDKLNANLPKGLHIIKAVKDDDNTIKFSKINMCDFIVKAETETEIDIDVDAFLSLNEIVINKRTKSGEKQEDIKAAIYALEVVERDGLTYTFKMRLAAGSTYNLKSATVIAAMEKYIEGFKVSFMQEHRLALMCDGKELM